MIDIGVAVPLNLQLFDGAEDKRVICTILSSELKELQTVELTHIKAGLYASTEFLMPEFPYVIANYVVFDSGGASKLKESEDYERSVDVFYSNEKPQDIAAIVKPMFEEHTPLKDDYLTGQIESSFESDDGFIEGKLENVET